MGVPGQSFPAFGDEAQENREKRNHRFHGGLTVNICLTSLKMFSVGKTTGASLVLILFYYF